MSFVKLNDILEDARKNKYAIPAFDVSNYEMIKAVLEVCEEEKSPAILMGLKPDLEGRGLHMLTSLIKAGAETVKIPVCLHLDHATEFEDIKAAIDSGFSSVMFDGSMLSFEENAGKTKEIAEYAHKHNVSIEAELGHVCNAVSGTDESIEDTVAENPEDSLTDVDEVQKFIDITNVDALAVAVGTAHGVYKSTPVLRFDRLNEINAVSKKPLVLHGGSGTPDGDIQKAVSLGITKINVFSEVLYGLNTGLKEKLTGIENMSMWPVCVYEDAIKNMRECVRNKIKVFGSCNRI